MKVLKESEKLDPYDASHGEQCVGGTESIAQRRSVQKMIPYGRHFLDEDDIQAVVDVLRNGSLTQGPMVAEFERTVAEYTGAKYAVAVSSGTAALHLACIAMDLGADDRVITSANTFVASANCALYVGAQPGFADIDSESLNIDPVDLQERCALTPNVKVIIPVHFGGYPCNMERIREIAEQVGAAVIEDACHALGAEYEDGSRVGNCKFSKMTVFSFHPVKGIAAGEGGMITTNDEHLFQRLLKLRSHGICKGNFEFPGISLPDDQLLKSKEAMEGDELRMWYYEMHELGLNYRITDIQCALALSQLKKIDVFLSRRKEIVATYDDAFMRNAAIRCTQVAGRKRSSHHIYVLRIDYDQLGLSRHQFMKRLASRGIGSQVHYIPVPAHPFYEKIGHRLSDYPNTELYYRQALSIPVYFGLSEDDQRNVIDAIYELVS